MNPHSFAGACRMPFVGLARKPRNLHFASHSRRMAALCPSSLPLFKFDVERKKTVNRLAKTMNLISISCFCSGMESYVREMPC